MADRYSIGGTAEEINAAARGTEDPVLYQTGRFENFSYGILLTNGNYHVILKLTELFWGSKGKRVFDVFVKGKRILRNLDLYAVAGKK